MRRILVVIARNLLLLAGGILPLWFIVAWASGLLWPSTQSYDTINAFLVGYLFIILPVLIAGFLQQIFFTTVIALRPILRRRWFAVTTALAIPFVINTMSAPLTVQFSTRFAAATLSALVVFALTMQFPPAN